jgi:hypothetical protein
MCDRRGAGDEATGGRYDLTATTSGRICIRTKRFSMSAPSAYCMRALENMAQKGCEGRAINVAQETKQLVAGMS